MATIFFVDVKTGEVSCEECKIHHGTIYNAPRGKRMFWKHAWTGGDVPPAKYAGKVFKQVRSILFRELLTICGGLDLWECAGTTRWDRARIFWNQATLSAWRTCERAGLE